MPALLYMGNYERESEFHDFVGCEIFTVSHINNGLWSVHTEWVLAFKILRCSANELPST